MLGRIGHGWKEPEYVTSVPVFQKLGCSLLGYDPNWTTGAMGNFSLVIPYALVECHKNITVRTEPDKTDRFFWHKTMTYQSTQITGLNLTSPVLIGSKHIKK